MKKKGDKRAGAGRPQNSNLEKTTTISFRVYEFAAPQIKYFFNKLTILEKSKLLTNIDNLLEEILNEQEEIISNPIRFNGVHVEKIKQIFNKYCLNNVQSF